MEDVPLELAVGAVLSATPLVFLALLAWAFGDPAGAGWVAAAWVTLLGSSFVAVLANRLFVRAMGELLGREEDVNLVSSTLCAASLCAAYAACIATFAQGSLEGGPWWAGVVAHLLGFVSAYFGYGVVVVWFRGTVPKLVSLPVTVLVYLVAGVAAAVG